VEDIGGPLAQQRIRGAENSRSSTSASLLVQLVLALAVSKYRLGLDISMHSGVTPSAGRTADYMFAVIGP
jgi:hypothetical protein